MIWALYLHKTIIRFAMDESSQKYLQAPKIYLIFGEVVFFSLVHLTFARFAYVQPLAAIFLIFGIIALPTILWLQQFTNCWQGFGASKIIAGKYIC